MADFVALYRGQTVAEAELAAVSASPSFTCRFLTELVGEPEVKQTAEDRDHAAAVFTMVPSDEG